MSKITAALEAAVAIVIENTPTDGTAKTNRQRVYGDRAFAGILKIIAPRIRHFIRQYGLVSHWEDAEQCCAIGVHRAIQGYDPTKAQFTTFVNWQLRGELQGLRFRLMTDQRPSAKKVSAATVSLHAVMSNADGEDMTLETMIVDESALELTESGASAHMATLTRTKLIEAYIDHLRDIGTVQLKRRARKTSLERNREIAGPRLRSAVHPIDPADLAALESKIALHREAIERRLSEDVEQDAWIDDEAVRERTRQVAKRATAAIAEMADRTPRFAASLSMPLPARPRRDATGSVAL